MFKNSICLVNCKAIQIEIQAQEEAGKDTEKQGYYKLLAGATFPAGTRQTMLQNGLRIGMGEC